jgi:ribosome biogenesis GTPase / thiamine phosphate phosphatase
VTRDPLAVQGVVLSGKGGIWTVHGRDGVVRDATLRGRLKLNESQKLAVGDEVVIEPAVRGEVWTIEELLPRRSQLSRRTPGGGYGERVVAANLDQVIVVFAVMRPEPHPGMLDRFLVIAEANDIVARIVVNKIELAGDNAEARAMFEVYEQIGYQVHYTSTKADLGLDALHETLQGRISALSGPSGVGKSSLLNAMYPALHLRVGEISESVNKGRHTTVGALAYPLPDGGYVVDTPGLREIGLWGLPSTSLDACFPEFAESLGTCRFQDCRHLSEPGCAVRQRVGDAIAPARYESYRKLREEIEASERVY